MWWQLELPVAVNLTEIQFDAPGGGRGFGIGSLGGGDGRATNATAGNAGGGRGAAPAAPPPSLAPKTYRVQVSLDGTRWSTPPVAEGTGITGQNIAAFKPVSAKYIRITQVATDAAAAAWTMSNVRLFVGK
jgi:hypothetical protein